MDEQLNDYVRNYQYRNGVMQYATEYCGGIFMQNMVKGSVLELGPAEGVMTDMLYPYFSDYSIVDGASKFTDLLKKKYPNMTVTNCFFEDYEPRRKFDNIILGHVLEHVDNPVQILKLCKSWLEEGGKIISAVPNSHSLHRQAAVEMGLLKAENELNETDYGVGHQRVYNMELLQQHFIEAELKICKSGGYWIKPISNGQIESQWTEEMVKAYLVLGEKYPDISAEIYIVATF